MRLTPSALLNRKAYPPSGAPKANVVAWLLDLAGNRLEVGAGFLMAQHTTSADPAVSPAKRLSSCFTGQARTDFELAWQLFLRAAPDEPWTWAESETGIQVTAQVVGRNSAGEPLLITGFHQQALPGSVLSPQTSPSRLPEWLDRLGIGWWEWNLETGTSVWSDGWRRLMGSEAEDDPTGYPSLIHKRIHPEDRKSFREGLARLLLENTPFDQRFRLKIRDNTYRWFEMQAELMRRDDARPYQVFATWADVHEKVTQARLLEKYASLLESAQEMAQMGAWEYDLPSNRLIWSPQVRVIHQTAPDYEPTIQEAIQFYLPEYRVLIETGVMNALLKGLPFDYEMKLRQTSGQEIWVRALGRALRDQQGQISGVVGVFMNIDPMKRRELEMAQSLRIISTQNQRLSEFTRIISHHLRNHSANLNQLVGFLEEKPLEMERQDIEAYLRSTSDGLTETLNRLQEALHYHIDFAKQRETLSLVAALEKTKDLLAASLQACEAVVEADFSAFDEANYLPSYLDHIFLNLISNAIRFRCPDRPLRLRVFTRTDETGRWLHFRDNGLGLDLPAIGDRLFQMYQTFHTVPESRGLGLYLVRNQVEAMGGEIRASGAPNKGAEFRIRF